MADRKIMELKLDGRSVRVSQGTRLLDLLRKQGVTVPTLCDHPELSATGHCRLCVVEVRGRGLVASCMARVEPGQIEDGAEVFSESELVRATRRTTLELLLASHPDGCLTCAKNPSCRLQELAAFIGVDEERLRVLRETAPRRAGARDESNPFFIRDPEKCVLCGICVRTCEELQGVGALRLTGSGAQTAVTAGTGGGLTSSLCESCGECVVRCPTGALAPRHSVQPSREVETTCTYCGVGCGLVLGVRGDKIVSAKGKQESPVNEGLLCVKGRFGNSFVHSPGRLKTPWIRKNGTLVEASWDEALDLVARKFTEYRGSAFAGISSSRATNEENYLVQKFVRSVMGTNNIDNCARLCHAPTMSGLALTLGAAGGTNPIQDLDGAECILVVGSNTTEAHAVVGARLRRAARKAKLIVVDPREIGLVRHADLWLPIRPGTDVVLLMGMARIIVDEGLADLDFISRRCEGFDEFRRSLDAFPLEKVAAITGVEAEKILQAARWYGQIKPAMLVWSLGITEHTHGTDNVVALANLALLTGNIGKPSAGLMPMRGQNNVQGSCDMGCIPGAFPGSQALTKPGVLDKFEKGWGVPLPKDPGLTVMEMLEAAEARQVKAFYIVGMDVAFSVPDVQRVQSALKAAEFVVVQDIFMTGTAKFADVVLPAASFAEKEGTFTNLERRVQLVRKAVEPPGEAKPDWWIVREIARRMGAGGFEFQNAGEILAELASLTPSYGGMSFERLSEGGLQWPCPAPDHPGTPRLHTEQFNTPSGRGRLVPLNHRPSFESVDAEFPVLLTTGRSLYHFHLAMTTQVDGLMKLHPEEFAWVHPVDAARIGVTDGEAIKVTSRRGSLIVKARVTDRVQLGQSFMTFHFYDQPTNILTHQAMDPVSKTPEFKVTAVRIEKAALPLS